MGTTELAGRIDLSFLRVEPESSVDKLREAVRLVETHGLRSLVVPPLLAGTVRKNYPQLSVCAVIAFPLGTETLAAKIFACNELIEQRVPELDVVLDLFALVNDNRRKIELEARELVDVTKPQGVALKAIIETPILNEVQIRWATEVLCEAGVNCVKTSAGYGREPTTLEHVRIIKESAKGRALIKASGGIRNQAQALAMIEAGADILGLSDAQAVLDLQT